MSHDTSSTCGRMVRGPLEAGQYSSLLEWNAVDAKCPANASRINARRSTAPANL